MIVKKTAKIKSGRTIAAEREPAESELDRLAQRKKTHRKSFLSVLAVAAMVTILGLITYLGASDLTREAITEDNSVEPTYQIQATIVDETKSDQISTRIREYMANLEQDFAELGYKVTRFTLPAGTSRELYVDVVKNATSSTTSAPSATPAPSDTSSTATSDATSSTPTLPFFKVTIDRDPAVSAEDAVRMLNYLAERDLHPTYVDVRVDGKAYYR